MRLVRLLILSLFVAGLGRFEFGQSLSAKALVGRAEDAFDRRPARQILLLGNSRTFFHDMPNMVRQMADSAREAQKFEITLDAPPGASFEILWNDAATQSLLTRRWDDVILQPESRAESSPDLTASFEKYGAKLIEASHVASGSPRLVVNWIYGANSWDDGDPDGSGRAAQYAAVQSDTKSLGDRAGARLVNVGQLWSTIAANHPEIALTEDGNHPTLAGSYLFALLLYADLTRHDVAGVTYTPAQLDLRTVSILKQAVRDYQSFYS
jgi:hypothetical protein